MRLDPWGGGAVQDYDRLIKDFGIQPITPNAEQSKLHYFKRGIIFGGRDFTLWWNDFKAGKKVSVLTGIMPSGPMHFGHKMVVDQIKFYQDLGVKCRVAVADIEAQTTRKMAPEDTQRIAIEEYLVNYIALGLDPKKTEFYAQSYQSSSYYSMASRFSARTTMAEMTDIYGDLSPAKITSSLIQMADIMHPQEIDGQHRVLVPVGIDQDPHLRLARDIAYRAKFVKPASTYHRFMTGLDGGKMSSSRASSYLGLNDSVEVAMKKISRVITGGRATTEEQRRLGGEADKCAKYELDVYHFIADEKKLQKIYDDCYSGKLLCGECKAITQEAAKQFYTKLEKERPKARKKLDKLNIFKT